MRVLTFLVLQIAILSGVFVVIIHPRDVWWWTASTICLASLNYVAWRIERRL